MDNRKRPREFLASCRRVEFPTGLSLRGASWRHRLDLDPAPDFVLALLGRPPMGAPWPCRWVRWPDFGLPASTDAAVLAVREVVERGREERVAVLCGSGVGRTGSALALVAALTGVPVEEAIGWVRRHYHPRAVETPWQRRWVVATASELSGP
ncbi:protein-tyrosine phosphatase family protein [Nigerium massiliense]|uniref:protein-tyrosine phosphatase family protein n=1 Tax=Nigerium massiliense TaxID=1522317 RepID=UPI000694EDBE|nr:protein-tyrosine phosphatase family protein [Nigerium massiliense]